MPDLRPLRALRFDAAQTDLSAVLAPPYDIINPAQRRELLGSDPHNIVRIELPADLGNAGPDDYASAAQVAAAWRRDGVLVMDAEPTVTIHEMAWRDAEGRSRTALGVFCRIRLEPYGPGGGVLPHERTHGGPKADRYALLEATGLNTSPIVFLAGDTDGGTSSDLLALAAGAPDATATTLDRVRHRLWIHSGQVAAPLLERLSAGPVTIADGHHRYETALAYQAAQRSGGATDVDPAWDYALALVYPPDQSPPVLPTHRVVRGEPAGPKLVEQIEPLGAIERLSDVDALLARMAEPAGPAAASTGSGRIGLLTDTLAVVLTLDRSAIEPWLEPGLSAASRGLDVNALGVIIGRVYADDPARMAAEGRLWYVKEASDATQQVSDAEATTAFLLDGMPPAAIAMVAEAGEVMPHKSTYFDPKAPTGLVLSALDEQAGTA